MVQIIHNLLVATCDTYGIIVHACCMCLGCGWFVPYVAKTIAKSFLAYHVNQPLVVMGIRTYERMYNKSLHAATDLRKSNSSVLKITVGHRPFSDQFQHSADQNLF